MASSRIQRTGGTRPHLWRRLFKTGAGIVGLTLTLIFVTVGVFAERISPNDPFAVAGPSLQAPSWGHPMGTDNVGRDLLRGVIRGINTSMTIVLGVVVISSVIGLAVGAIAGYRRGIVDDLLMRVTELFQSVPRFFLALMTLALFGPGLNHLTLLLGLTSWTLLARVVRAETLSIRERPFVEAAGSYGAPARRIMSKHVLLNVLPPVAIVISLTASRVILIEAGLAFLGLGDQNRISLGFLANNAQDFYRLAWWMAVWPGVVIALAVLSFNLLSDALSDLAGGTTSGGLLALRV